MKKVLKYGTGQEIPEGAIYLTTLKQIKISETFRSGNVTQKINEDCWLVWHYFLVEVK